VVGPEKTSPALCLELTKAWSIRAVVNPWGQTRIGSDRAQIRMKNRILAIMNAPLVDPIRMPFLQQPLSFQVC
jgi:hypothetical protein